MDEFDNGLGIGNNENPETISKIILTFPQDTAEKTVTLSGSYVPTSGTVSGVGSAEVTFDAGARTYTFTSTDLAGDLAATTASDRADAEQDIRDTLAPYSVEVGPQHTDLNLDIGVSVTTVDVVNGTAATEMTNFTHLIRIQAVADVPSVSVVASEPAEYEDSGNGILLHISATMSNDQDDSETLSVQVRVASDSYGYIGTITGTTPTNVTLTPKSWGAKISASGETPLSRQTTLNSFTDGGGVYFMPRANYADENSRGVRARAVSTEGATGNEVSVKTAKSKWENIGIVVYPVADAPVLAVKGNARGYEDVSDTSPPCYKYICTLEKKYSLTILLSVTLYRFCAGLFFLITGTNLCTNQCDDG